MPDIRLTLTEDELCIIKAATAYYRVAGFPLGKSSYGNPISYRDRREFAAFGMKLWERIANLQRTDPIK